MPKLNLDAIPQTNATGYPDVDMHLFAENDFQTRKDGSRF